jgi:hypothetical protein
VENMGLKSMLTGKWFARLVMISWIICAVAILVIFKNMELIVHGQLYYYGLIFSPDWADAYRVLTWLIFLCLGLPMALSGIALASSFLKLEKVPKRENIVPQKAGPPRGIVKVESRQPHQTQETAREAPRRVDNGNCVGISCPECKKVFGRALVMLDFRSGSNRMVSVCPYCNSVLGYTSEEKGKDESFYVASPDKKIVQ